MADRRVPRRPHARADGTRPASQPTGPAAPTVADLIARVGPAVLGDRVRRLRVAAGLSVRDVAARGHLSKTSVVRLEHGEPCRPKTLVSVCEVLGVHLRRLADDEAPDSLAVHRVGDDRWHDMTDVAGEPLGTSAGRVTAREVAVAVNLLRSRLPNGRVLPTILAVHRPSEPRSHPGEEFVLVLAGKLRLSVGSRTVDLRAGESACFQSGELHRYAPIGRTPARILSIRVDG